VENFLKADFIRIPLAWYSTRRFANYCARQEDKTGRSCVLLLGLHAGPSCK